MTINPNIYIFVIMFAFLNANTPWDYTLSLGRGYDSNVMRFSAEEIDNAGQKPEILGSASHFDSFVNKIGFSVKKDLWILTRPFQKEDLKKYENLISSGTLKQIDNYIYVHNK